MKAIRYYRYGPPDVLRFEDVDMPAVGDDDVLVRVRAASVNPLDWHFMRGAPYMVRVLAGLSRPRGGAGRLGADMAGSVEAVGKNVTEFRPGDEVFGGLEDRGTLAEYVSIRHDGAVAAKPAGLTFEQAASVPVAAFTALQALRDKGRVRPGHKVLVNGASGGVGTFAVQLAKAFGGWSSSWPARTKPIWPCCASLSRPGRSPRSSTGRIRWARRPRPSATWKQVTPGARSPSPGSAPPGPVSAGSLPARHPGPERRFGRDWIAAASGRGRCRRR
jgi:hypothetical protein